MEQISFIIEKEEKEKLKEIAKSNGLGLATYCRFILINTMKEDHNELK